MKTLLELEANECRFPFGESDFKFCGRPTHLYMRFEKICSSPYCREHHLICIVEPVPAKRAAA
jgi:hypothetical protein